MWNVVRNFFFSFSFSRKYIFLATRWANRLFVRDLSDYNCYYIITIIIIENKHFPLILAVKLPLEFVQTDSAGDLKPLGENISILIYFFLKICRLPPRCCRLTTLYRQEYGSGVFIYIY